MGLFRRKPLLVEVFRYGYDDEPPWFAKAQAEYRVAPQPGLCAIAVGTDDSPRYWTFAQEGDLIILGPGNRIWCCEAESFYDLYEEVAT